VTGQVSDDIAELLTPLVRQYEAKLRFRRTSPRSGEPNHGGIIET
jgi:hypothetical protein